MKQVHFDDVQQGIEWLLWRSKGIGATDVAVIMEDNPYKTRLQLWEEKCGYKDSPPMNAAMLHGKQFEDVARQYVNSQNEWNLVPICAEDEEHSYMRASLDGFDKANSIVCEIKCPVNKETIRNFREHGFVPSYWLTQLQWQLMLTNAYKGYIAVWDYESNTAIIKEFMPNKDLFLKLRKEVSAFWNLIVSGIPPLAKDSDYIELDDPELVNLMWEYSSIDAQEKEIKERKKELKEKIIDFGDDGNFKVLDYTITRTSPKTSYDIDQMRMDGIDVDSYKKKNNGIGFYTIRKTKAKK